MTVVTEDEKWKASGKKRNYDDINDKISDSLYIQCTCRKHASVV